MTAQAINGAEELSASRVNWKRLRRLALNCGLLACAVSGTVFYMNGGVSGVLLRADGLVLRERVAVAPAFDGRVAQVFVRPGDHVEKGQRIAVVKSVAISRTLADLAAEKARGPAPRYVNIFTASGAPTRWCRLTRTAGCRSGFATLSPICSTVATLLATPEPLFRLRC